LKLLYSYSRVNFNFSLNFSSFNFFSYFSLNNFSFYSFSFSCSFFVVASSESYQGECYESEFEQIFHFVFVIKSFGFEFELHTGKPNR
jgi:hypothetical protein